MKKRLKMTLFMGAVCAFSANAFAGFKSLKSLDAFVDQGSWELHMKGKAPVDVEFETNHTLPEDKAITLGNKKYRFWSVAKHPTVKDRYILRVHSKKTAGWYSFTWNAAAKAWTSKHWPQISIKKK